VVFRARELVCLFRASVPPSQLDIQYPIYNLQFTMSCEPIQSPTEPIPPETPPISPPQFWERKEQIRPIPTAAFSISPILFHAYTCQKFSPQAHLPRTSNHDSVAPSEANYPQDSHPEYRLKGPVFRHISPNPPQINPAAPHRC
jgi:hypothetical protein